MSRLLRKKDSRTKKLRECRLCKCELNDENKIITACGKPICIDCYDKHTHECPKCKQAIGDPSCLECFDKKNVYCMACKNG